MRGVAVAVLLLFAGILSLASNVGLWVDRTVYDTDNFVATTDEVLDDEDVQTVLADRFAEELFISAEIESRLQAELPSGLKFLALPLSTAAREFLRDASLRLLERQPFEDVRNAALRQTHATLINVIEGDSDAVTTEGDAIVLDLRPVLERVAQDVTGRDVNLPQEGGAEPPEAEIPEEVLQQLPPEVRERIEAQQDEGLLARLDLGEDAGRFVIEDSSIAWAYRIARYGNDIVYAVVGVTVACYVAAIVIARDRRSTLRTAGIVLAIAGVVSLALLLPLGYTTRAFARHDAAAMSIVDIITAGFKQQSLVMVGAGGGIAAIAALFGGTSLAVAIRSTVKRTPDAPSMGGVLRERVAALRIAGLVGAALLLIIWPDPTARVYVTILGLLAVYLVALFLLASDAQPAVSFRREADRLWGQWVAPPPAESLRAEHSPSVWITLHAGWLRFAGVAAGLGLLLFWPSLNLRFFVMVVALAFIYLAVIDLAGNRAAKRGEER